MSGTEHLPYYLQVVVEDSDLGVQRGPIWGIQRADATQGRFRISGGWRPTVYYATSNSEDVLAVMRVPFPELRVLHF